MTTTTSAPFETTALASTSRSGIYGADATLRTFEEFDTLSIQALVHNEENDGWANVKATAFDHEGDVGSHMQVEVHHGTRIEIVKDELFGPSIVIRTAAGYNVRINVFGDNVEIVNVDPES